MAIDFMSIKAVWCGGARSRAPPAWLISDSELVNPAYGAQCASDKCCVCEEENQREGDHRILETRHSIKAETKEADKEVFVQLGLLPSLNGCLHKLVCALTLMSVFNSETALELYLSFFFKYVCFVVHALIYIHITLKLKHVPHWQQQGRRLQNPISCEKKRKKKKQRCRL